MSLLVQSHLVLRSPPNLTHYHVSEATATVRLVGIISALHIRTLPVA